MHPDGFSVVLNGEHKDKELRDGLKDHPQWLGTKVQSTELPIFVKFIDAKIDLSVQVHPDDVYAREDEQQNGNSEFCYVIDVDEGANLIYGFQHTVTEKILRRALEIETLDRHLEKCLYIKEMYSMIHPKLLMVSEREYCLQKFGKVLMLHTVYMITTG